MYWPDAHDDHGRFVGNAYEFIDNTLERLHLMRQTNHFVGNIIMRIDGSGARVQTNFIAYHCYRGAIAGENKLSSEGPLVNDLLGGRFLDRMEKRSGEWRIQNSKVMFDWYRAADPAAPELEKGFNGFADRAG